MSTSFHLIPAVLVLFSYAQEFALCYLPLICDYHRKNKKTGFTTFISILLLYHSSPPKYLGVEPVVMSLFIVIVTIVATTLILFLLIIKGYSIPKAILQSRGLLFLYVPSTYLSVLANHLGFCLEILSSSTDNNSHVIINMIIVVITALIIFAFTMWVDPLILKSPIHSKSHIPSKIIPTYHFFFNQTLLQIYAIVTTTANTKTGTIFFVIPAIFYGLYNIYSFIKLPYLSKVDTCMSLSNGVCLIIIPLTIQLFLFFDYNNEVILSLGGALVFFISFLIFNIIIRVRERNTKFVINSGHISFSSAEQAIRFCQYAILKDKITPELINGLSDYNRIQGSPDVLTIEVYVRLLKGREEDFNVIDHMITPLAFDKSSSWIHRFTLYEISRQYYRSYLSRISKPNLEEINRLISCYDATYDRFWTEILTGDINQARNEVFNTHKSYNELRFKFSLIKSFYPDHEDISTLYNDFFSKFDNITEFGGKLSDLIIRRSYFINIKKKQNYSQFDSPSSFFYNNLRKSLFVWERSCFIFAVVLFLAIVLILAMPGYAASEYSEPLKAVPQFIKSTQNLMTAWTSISTAISHIENNTIYIYNNCSEYLHGEIKYHCQTVQNLIDNIEENSHDVLEQLAHINEMFDEYSMYSDFSQAQKLWINRDIVMFNAQTDIDPLIGEIIQNIRSIFIFIAGHIIVKNGNIRSEESRLMWPDAIVFSNFTISILKKLGETYEYYSSFINFIKEDRLYLFSPELIAIFAVLSVIFLVTLFVFEYSYSKYYFGIYQKYFCTREHPRHIDIIYETPQYRPYKTNIHVQALTICGTVIILISIAANVLFNIQIQKAYINGIQGTQAVHGSAIICQLSCLLSKLLFSFWQFNNSELLDDAYDLIQVTIDKIIEVQELLSPNHLRLFKDWIPTALKYENISDIVQNATSHKLLDSSNLFKIANTFTYGSYFGTVEGKKHKNITKSIMSQEHILEDHMIIKFTSLASEMADQINITADHSQFLSFLSICVNIVIFIAMVIIIAIFALFHKSYLMQFNRLITYLDPSFIVRHQCLVSFFMRTNDDFTGLNSPFFSLLSSANIKLVLTTADLSIVSATSSVQAIFGQMSQQLIGQNLTILIPNTGRNDVSLYKSIKMILRRQSEPNFTREVVGQASDGTEFPIKVSVSLLEMSESQFLLVEFISLDEASYIESNFIKCNEVAMDLVSMSIPLALFELNDNRSYLKSHFDRGAMTFISFAEDNYQSRDELYDIKVMFVRDMVPLLSGYGNGFVLRITSSYALIVFAEINETNSHINNAFEIFRAFLGSDSIRPFGFIVSTNSFDAIVFKEPETPSKYEDTLIPLEEARKLSGTMTIEPQIEEFNMFPQLLTLVKPGTILLSSDIAASLENTYMSKVPNSHIDMYYIDVSIL